MVRSRPPAAPAPPRPSRAPSAVRASSPHADLRDESVRDERLVAELARERGGELRVSHGLVEPLAQCENRAGSDPFVRGCQDLARRLRPRRRPGGTARPPRLARRTVRIRAKTHERLRSLGPGASGAITSRSCASARRASPDSKCRYAASTARASASLGAVRGVSSLARSSRSAAGRGAPRARACRAAPRGLAATASSGSSTDAASCHARASGSSSSSASRAWISARRRGSAVSSAPAASSGCVKRIRSPSVSTTRASSAGGEADVPVHAGRLLGDRDRRVRVGRRGGQEVAALGRQGEQSTVHEVVERVGNGQRPPRLDRDSRAIERAHDLEREERVAAGGLVHFGRGAAAGERRPCAPARPGAASRRRVGRPSSSAEATASRLKLVEKRALETRAAGEQETDALCL